LSNELFPYSQRITKHNFHNFFSLPLKELIFVSIPTWVHLQKFHNSYFHPDVLGVNVWELAFVRIAEVTGIHIITRVFLTV